MRIGIDCHVLSGRSQGSKTWLKNSIPALAQSLPSCTLALYVHALSDADEFKDFANVQVYLMPSLPALLRIAAYWPAVIVRHKLDLLLTQYISPLIFPQRQIVVVHDILFETHPHFFPVLYRSRNRLLVRLSARRARLVVTVSEYSRAQIHNVYKVPQEKIVLSRNGVKLPGQVSGKALSVIDSRLKGEPYLLYLGRLEPRKNLRLALDAYQSLNRRDVQFVVIGKNDFEDQSTIDRLIEPGILHLEDASDEDVDILLRNAHALVYPSLGEGWGIPITEALSRGTAVIASSTTAMPEAGEDLATYFDPNAKNAISTLAQLMKDALSSDKMRPTRDQVERFATDHTWALASSDLTAKLNYYRVDKVGK